MTRLLARAVAGAALVAALTPAAGGAASVPGPTSPTLPSDVPSRLALLAQAAWTPLGGVFQARLQIAVSASGEQLSFIAHDALSARKTFDKTVVDQQLGPVLTQVVVPVDGLATASDGSRAVSIPISSPAGAFDQSHLALPGSGVYPLEVELRDSQEQGLARFVTYLVAVGVGPGGQPAPLTNRLGVAWVWPLATRPGVNPDGSIDPGVAAALQPTGQVGRQVAASGNHPSVPVTLAPSPETLDTWSALARTDAGAAAGAAALRAAASGPNELLGGPYVPIDLPSLLHAGLGNVADAEAVQGQVSIDRFFGTHVDERTALALPADAGAVDRLRARGVDQVVVDANAVGAGAGRVTTATPFSLEPSPSLAPTGPVAAVADDTSLASTLTSTGVPALRAQRFLAGLALTALEQPGKSRAAVVVNPDGFDAAPALVDAVLTGLSGNPWLAPTTLQGVFTGVAPASGDVRSLAPYTPPTPTVTTRAYNAAQSRLIAFGSLVGPGDPRIARGERFLLSSVSSAWTGAGGPTQARAELSAVDTIVNGFLAGIRIPAPGTITLTARSGAIPITFRNDTGQPVRVTVALSSRKLDFPSGSVQTVALPPRSTTIRFDVRTRTSGTFPLLMSIRSADGSLLIAEGRFKVRSTVVSSVGLALGVGAGVFLTGWWALDFRRRRRLRAAAAR